MRNERLVEIKAWLSKDRGDSVGDELLTALEAERARLEYLTLDSDLGAFSERHGLTFQTSRRVGTPTEWRARIDEAMRGRP